MMTQEQAEAAARELDRACGIVLVPEHTPPWEIASAVEDILGTHLICAHMGKIMRLQAGAFVTMTNADVEWAVEHYCQFWSRQPGVKWQRIRGPSKSLTRELITRARTRASKLPTPAETNANAAARG
jgi:hypothetical protein